MLPECIFCLFVVIGSNLLENIGDDDVLKVFVEFHGVW